MNLYNKYRPKTLDEVYGNTSVCSVLEHKLSTAIKEFPKATLLHGPTGCGKTTLGRIIAARLQDRDTNEPSTDFREIDSADFRGIDTIREIRRQIQFHPQQSNCQVWLLDECHKLSNDAQNAMLKALENPPPNVFFILCTTEPNKLISTIRGRCNILEVSPLHDKDMRRLISSITRAEGDKLFRELIMQIVQDSLGQPRNALQIVEQVLSVPKEDRVEVAKRTAEQKSKSIELCRALLQEGGGWKKVANILKDLKDEKEDPESVRRQVLGYCQSILLNGSNPLAGLAMEEFSEPFYNIGFPGLVLACYKIVEGDNKDDIPF